MRMKNLFVLSMAAALFGCNESPNGGDIPVSNNDGGDIVDIYERYDYNKYDDHTMDDASFSGTWILSGSITLINGSQLHLRSGFYISDSTFFPAVIHRCGIADPQLLEGTIGEYYYQPMYIGSDLLQIKMDYLPQEFSELKVSLAEDENYSRYDIKAYKISNNAIDQPDFGTIKIEEESRSDPYATNINCFFEYLKESENILYMTASSGENEQSHIDLMLEVVSTFGSSPKTERFNSAALYAEEYSQQWKTFLLKGINSDLYQDSTIIQTDRLEFLSGLDRNYKLNYFVEYNLSIPIPIQ